MMKPCQVLSWHSEVSVALAKPRKCPWFLLGSRLALMLLKRQVSVGEGKLAWAGVVGGALAVEVL